VILGILAASVTVSGILANTGVLVHLIPYVLGSAAVLAILITMSVVVINYKRPQSLMLGEITGTEYAAIERTVLLGDSRQGERAVVTHEPVSGTPSGLITEAVSSSETLAIDDAQEQPVPQRSESDAG